MQCRSQKVESYAMPLHPQARTVLDRMTALGLKFDGDPAAIRTTLATFPRPEGEAVADVENRKIPGPEGPIPVRIYSPAPRSDKPRGALVWFHGGGWVIGELDTADFSCRALANRSGSVVVSVDYRLAPEAKYPAAADDCLAATRWVAEQAATIGVDPRRVAVGGDSAGGNLAAVVAQQARELNGPALTHQVLVYPVTDYHFETASYRENAEGYLLTRDSMIWFWHHYLSSPSEGLAPKASPMRATDLSGLPPATVITAQYDPLRDEGEAYAVRLQQAGVPTELLRYEGQTHGFFGNPLIDDGMSALDRVAAALRASFLVA